MAESNRLSIEQIFRDEYGRVVSSLIRQIGDFGIAEEAVQEACEAALTVWPKSGLPPNPGGWLMTTAKRKAIDKLRRSANYRVKQRAFGYREQLDRLGGDPMDELSFDESQLRDDQLKLIFTCCHPALGIDAQVALTVKALGGLTTAEIARGFVVSETTIAQRIVRAKRKIKSATIPYRVPGDDELPDRLASVLGVLYLIFNEGYAALSGRNHVRDDLCLEAIRLGELLEQLMPDEPEVVGLNALMGFHRARRATRTDSDGTPVLLEDQDRSLWHTVTIEAMDARLIAALRRGQPGLYQVQAAIAGVHATAPSFAETDWVQIVGLYDSLIGLVASPVVELNRAVAIAMAFGERRGLDAMVNLAEPLQDYAPYHSARGELLARVGNVEGAIKEFETAIGVGTSDGESSRLRSKIVQLTG
ncbi:MAG: RNA polymerase sigma factor [Acidobacteria bacterium]|nr:RNA polymerase sigma factor [Acidobacteriota bacterium]